MAIWRAVKVNYPDLWGNDNNLTKKVSINALNEFIADRLKAAWSFSLVDIYDPDDVEKQVFRMLQIPEKFWQTEWSIKIQDNSNVRTLIKNDLATITDNLKLRRNWEENLQLLNSN